MTICLRNIKSFFVESWNLKKGKVIKHANGVGLKTLMDGIFELSSFNRFFSQFRVLQSRFGIQIRLFQTQYSSSVLLQFIDQFKHQYMVCYYHDYFTMHKYYFLCEITLNTLQYDLFNEFRCLIVTLKRNTTVANV